MRGLPRQRIPAPLLARWVAGGLVLVGGGAVIALALWSDRLLAGLYDSWRPRLERQVGRVMGHPLQLGPYQGLGPDGLRVGPSRFLAGAEDGSTGSVRGLRVLIDPIASWRSRSLVLDLSLSGARADLRANDRGQLWVLGRVPPGGDPPALQLRLRLLQEGELTLHGLGSASEALRFRLAGHTDLLLQQRRLQGRLRVRLPGHGGVADLQGGGNWQTRLWAMQVSSRSLALTALRPFLPRQAQLAGQADGRVQLSWRQGRSGCRGGLQLRQVSWRQQGLPGVIRAERLPVACDDGGLTLARSPWRYGPWNGLASGTLQPGRRLDLQLRSTPPAGLGLPVRPVEARLQGLWRGAALQGARLELASGASRLQAQGQLGRSLDLTGWWRLDPQDLPRAARLPAWVQQQPIAGRFRLAGPVAQPSLALATSLQGRHPLLGAWQASLRWHDDLLQLDRFRAGRLQAEARLPLRFGPGRRLESGPLQAWVDLRDFPLAGFNPLVGSRLQGRLDARGWLRGPLAALVPDLELEVRSPAAGPLRLPETWRGHLRGGQGGGGLLQLQALAPALPARLEASLDRRWQPRRLQLSRGEGSLALVGDLRRSRWQARSLPLQGLELLPGGSHPAQPLLGDLSGAGELGLQPLTFSGQLQLLRPGMFALGGRRLAARFRYADRRYEVRGTVEPLSAGTIATELSGRWGGAFRARFQARDLSSLLFHQMAHAWQRWRGLAQERQGRAADLGQPAIETLGFALQDQLAVLATVQQRLRNWEEEQRRASRAERLGQLRMRIDADLTLQGPDLPRARADLQGRGHLWLDQQERDLALAREPFTLELSGPVFRGAGSFAISGLTLSLLSLLTPVPDSLRGYLNGRGRYRLGGARPEVAMELSLEQTELAERGLLLQRGLLELKPGGLAMDLALQAEGATGTVDLAGLLPLEAASRTMELRLSSRGDGLRFLTDLAGRAISWRQGSVDLQLLVRGSLLDPIANGFLRFRDGEYGFIGQTLRDVEATVLFDFRQLLVQDLRARVGERGRISGEGQLGLVRSLQSGPFLALQLQQVPFSLERIKAVADGRLQLGGSLAAPQLGGAVTISRGTVNVQPGQLATVDTKSSRGADGQGGSQGAPPPQARPGGADRPMALAPAPGQPVAQALSAAASPGGEDQDPPVAPAPPVGGAGSAALTRRARLSVAEGGPVAGRGASPPPASSSAPPSTPEPRLFQESRLSPATQLSPESRPPATPQPVAPKVLQPTSMNNLLQQRWDFREPLLLVGPDVESSANLSLQEAIPNLPWLQFQDLQLSFGPDLRVVLPSLANFSTAGSLRISGRLDPSLRASGVVRLLKGRLNLFTTTFSLDPDAPNVAVFTPSLGLVPYLDIALRTRIADNLDALSPSGLPPVLQPGMVPGERDSGSYQPLSSLSLILVTVSVSGPADRLADNLRLRSSPPLPQERLVALIGGNSLAGLQGGQAGTALATALGQSLLSPLLATLGDAFGQRVSLALFPTYVNQVVSDPADRFSRQVPPQLVLVGEVGFDISDRFNASVLAAPNRSDVPSQLNLNYKASENWNVGASIDSQGAWQTVLQFFFRF
ncbi:MAG: translocation/assembly module TamB domain-containing protein [Cyanobium sp.]